MSAYANLPRPRLRAFVDAYVQTRVGAAAMRAIGYQGKPKSAARIAWGWLQRPEVQAAVAEKRAEATAAAGIETTRVLQEAAALALFNPLDLLDTEGKLIPLHKLPRNVAAAIGQVDFDKDGHVKRVKVHNKPETVR
ncbi:MAG: terminase small subunit, partial [Steroidobacteraceae bacterium]